MRVVCIVVACMAVSVLADPVRAGTLNCVALDPSGDASNTPGIVGEPYEDIVRAGISQHGPVYLFTLDLAGAIPESPPLLPPGVTLIVWVWGIDTDPGFMPTGYPFAPGTTRHTEIVVHVIWDGMGYKGELIDARPQLTGGTTIVRPVPFKIKDARVTAFVGADLIDPPPNFGASTVLFASPLGAPSFFVLDNAPDAPPQSCSE